VPGRSFGSPWQRWVSLPPWTAIVLTAVPAHPQDAVPNQSTIESFDRVSAEAP
jgi:hypothetical protein